ncbi:MAG: protein tyrosine phosphatase family protein [Pseudomonadales bacterium]|jgi:protein tyrosine phosphatase (PTP) superfamily phosphohydrolase (DUF442 family)|nr:protein tyrosine phosphatase family protein [Pseudomonadales bacterium]
MNEIERIYNYRYVSDELATSGQPSVAQLQAIAAADFSTIINLALHDDPRYSLPDEARSVAALGMKYIHIPVQFATPTQQDLLAFFETMDSHYGQKVWVHCAANMRVSAFLGLYRVLRLGWEEERAFDLMDSLWKPNEVWSAFISTALNVADSILGGLGESAKALEGMVP